MIQIILDQIMIRMLPMELTGLNRPFWVANEAGANSTRSLARKPESRRVRGLDRLKCYNSILRNLNYFFLFLRFFENNPTVCFSSIFKGATSRFAHLENFTLNFSSSSFAIRVSLLRPCSFLFCSYHFGVCLPQQTIMFWFPSI